MERENQMRPSAHLNNEMPSVHRIKFFQTVAGPDSTPYPEKADNPNVYYARMLKNPTFTEEVGQQVLNYGITEIFKFIFNLEAANYIEEGSVIKADELYNRWWTIDKVRVTDVDLSKIDITTGALAWQVLQGFPAQRNDGLFVYGFRSDGVDLLITAYRTRESGSPLVAVSVAAADGERNWVQADDYTHPAPHPGDPMQLLTLVASGAGRGVHLVDTGDGDELVVGSWPYTGFGQTLARAGGDTADNSVYVISSNVSGATHVAKLDADGVELFEKIPVQAYTGVTSPVFTELFPISPDRNYLVAWGAFVASSSRATFQYFDKGTGAHIGGISTPGISQGGFAKEDLTICASSYAPFDHQVVVRKTSPSLTFSGAANIAVPAASRPTICADPNGGIWATRLGGVVIDHYDSTGNVGTTIGPAAGFLGLPEADATGVILNDFTVGGGSIFYSVGGAATGTTPKSRLHHDRTWFAGDMVYFPEPFDATFSTFSKFAAVGVNRHEFGGTPVEFRTLDHQECLGVTVGGGHLFAFSADGQITKWNLSGGKIADGNWPKHTTVPRRTHPFNPRFTDGSIFYRDGEVWLAPNETTTELEIGDPFIEVYDADGGALLRTYKYAGHHSPVHFAFSPGTIWDGNFVISGTTGILELRDGYGFSAFRPFSWIEIGDSNDVNAPGSRYTERCYYSAGDGHFYAWMPDGEGNVLKSATVPEYGIQWTATTGHTATDADTPYMGPCYIDDAQDGFYVGVHHEAGSDDQGRPLGELIKYDAAGVEQWRNQQIGYGKPFSLAEIDDHVYIGHTVITKQI